MSMKPDKNLKRQEFQIKDIINKVDKKTLNKIDEYVTFKKSSGEVGTDTRALKLQRVLIKIAFWLKKDFQTADKDDLIKLIEFIDKQNYSAWTKHDYKVILKNYYKWSEGENEEFPKKIRWLKPKGSLGKGRFLPKQILSEDDVLKMIKQANHPRDKALISVLYESGCRIGELLPLRKNNVTFTENHCVIVVSGKTGDRRIILISSAPMLAAWMNNHPVRNDKKAFVWMGYGKRNNVGLITYSAVCVLLKRLAEEAKLPQDKMNPHLLRHSRATFLANHLTESQMCAYFGWEIGSEMPRIYVSRSGIRLDSAIKKLNGQEVEKEEMESKLSPKKCPRCRKIHSATSRFCEGCGCVLDIKTAMELEKKSEDARFVENEVDITNVHDRLQDLEAKFKVMNSRGR